MKPIPTAILKSVAKRYKKHGLVTFGGFIGDNGLGLNDGQNLWRRLRKHGYLGRYSPGIYMPTDTLNAEIRTRDGK